MDSTPTQQQQQQRLILKIVPPKLPIKRKSPDHPHTNPNPNPNLTPKLELSAEDSLSDDIKPPAFKFHRVWTEPDEIRFLQGLLDSPGLIFPRDLHIFYKRFTQTTAQPYTKSQLSEKLRRLRKKFRLISGRIERGLHPSLLSPHDQSLFHLSTQLWHPDYSSSSPFNANNTIATPTLTPTPTATPTKKLDGIPVAVPVMFNPTFTLPSAEAVTAASFLDNEDDNDNDNDDKNCDAGYEEELNLRNGEIRRIVAKVVVDVFESSIEEVRSQIVQRGTDCSSSTEKAADLMKRCREQLLLELDVLARRMRLVHEKTINDL